MSVEIKETRIGVPFVIDGDEVVPLTPQFTGDLVALEHLTPGTLDALMRRIKLGVEVITGIDSDLDDLDWMRDFYNVMLVAEFSLAVQVVSEARQSVSRMMEGLHEG